MPGVKCTIDNCHYWVPGNECQAREILITNDAVAAKLPNRYDAKEVDSIVNVIGESPASTCTDTCCKTFEQGGSKRGQGGGG
ncbi:MAG TPA: DUF1540 domain-containing protein [Bacillota bacterium]